MPVTYPPTLDEKFTPSSAAWKYPYPEGYCTEGALPKMLHAVLVEQTGVADAGVAGSATVAVTPAAIIPTATRILDALATDRRISDPSRHASPARAFERGSRAAVPARNTQHDAPPFRYGTHKGLYARCEQTPQFDSRSTHILSIIRGTCRCGPQGDSEIPMMKAA